MCAVVVLVAGVLVFVAYAAGSFRIPSAAELAELLELASNTTAGAKSFLTEMTALGQTSAAVASAVLLWFTGLYAKLLWLLRMPAMAGDWPKLPSFHACVLPLLSLLLGLLLTLLVWACDVALSLGVIVAGLLWWLLWLGLFYLYLCLHPVTVGVFTYASPHDDNHKFKHSIEGSGSSTNASVCCKCRITRRALLDVADATSSSYRHWSYEYAKFETWQCLACHTILYTASNTPVCDVVDDYAYKYGYDPDYDGFSPDEQEFPAASTMSDEESSKLKSLPFRRNVLLVHLFASAVVFILFWVLFDLWDAVILLVAYGVAPGLAIKLVDSLPKQEAESLVHYVAAPTRWVPSKCERCSGHLKKLSTSSTRSTSIAWCTPLVLTASPGGVYLHKLCFAAINQCANSHVTFHVQETLCLGNWS